MILFSGMFATLLEIYFCSSLSLSKLHMSFIKCFYGYFSFLHDACEQLKNSILMTNNKFLQILYLWFFFSYEFAIKLNQVPEAPSK